MSMNRDIAVLVGSLRKDSFNRKMAHTLIELAPSGLKLGIVEIGPLPHYNQDLETPSPPAPWVAFRDSIRPAHGVIFVTPEYNRSVPGVLKNAIDVGSRPSTKNVCSGKPAGIISSPQGEICGYGDYHPHLQSLAFPVIP